MFNKYVFKNNLYRKLFLLSLPITIENLIYSFINFIDVFMVGSENENLKLGANAISALGASNQFFFLFIISLFGILSGAGILASQYYGAKDFKNLRKLTSLFSIISIIFSAPFFIAGFFFTKEVISFYTNDLDVINLAYEYLKIMIWLFPVTSISMLLITVLRSINLPKYTLYSSIIGLILNISLNLYLIPIYGVRGAAIATVLSRVTSLLFLIFILINKKINLIAKKEEFLEINKSFLKKCYKASIYTFLHEVLWSLAITIKASIFGRTGSINFSSIQIALSINSLLFTIYIGLTSATSVIVGNELGDNKFERAYNYTKEIIKIYAIITVIIIVILNLMSPFILRVMGVSNEVYYITRQIIYSLSIVGSLSSITMLFLVGIFRAGGDTKYSILIEIIPLWLISLPMMYLVITIYPSIPIAFLYLLSYIDEFIKIFPCIFRYKSKKWIKKVI